MNPASGREITRFRWRPLTGSDLKILRVATEPHCQYLIRIRGRLGATALSAFPTMGAEIEDDETVLTGLLEDRSAVYGVLAQIEALGLELLELRRVGPTPTREP